MMKKSLFLTALSLAILTGCQNVGSQALQIEKQGSFTVGGSYVTHKGTFKQENFIAPEGQRAYGDFAYVKYQTPTNAKKYPLVFQHGGAQSSRTWESTVDGREGFDTLFLRKGYSTYLVDQPRSGKSNLSTKAITPDTPWASNPMYADKTFWILSRMGHYDSHNQPVANAQFPAGEAAYQAFQQAWTIGSGPLDNDLNADVLTQLVDQTKGAILVTHSMGGTIGWRTALRTDNVKAIVAWEPGGTPFIFPENEMPKITKARFEALSGAAMGVPMNEFLKLTKIPIVLYYGDYIQVGSDNVGEDKWGTELAMAKQFVATINKHGGDATLVHLPEIGIKGNSHFLMGEKNNQQLADLMADWLKQKELDK
ncbi:alpha/beta hydrolase [[Mannheimia] succiniciproducens]|uniref:AB hydrolase-1 domain-containing protein n=1 Tax=Mannheimia succiniciproducens (strain KCTC 0769BP / MBEL55E) TaxID=221988 RepID=Q65SQ6_MANSM|nr:alpha/beta fold hydrolase [[Mannheimia] succiniciproducens]AAU38004.1 unknown [[Mannheimia] succiniciproducens MBEL55E]